MKRHLTRVALATVRESPVKRSSDVFSGTTAQNSILAQPSDVGGSEQLVDGLRDLWDVSEQVLNKILPRPITAEAIQDLATRLQNAPRHRNDILGQYQKLKDVMDLYPGKPINVVTTCLTIFGLSKAEELREGPHRPDEILYKANLAYVVGIFAEKLIYGIDDFDLEEMLQFFSRSLFSKVLRSSERSMVGSSSLLKSTFELAIDLQTQDYIAKMIDTIADGGDTFPDPSAILKSTFFKEDGLTLLNWNVSGGQSDNLTKSQRVAIADRMANVRSKVQNFETQDPQLEALRAEFPVTDLIYRFFLWARERNAELGQQMNQIPGGPLGIQEAIDTEIMRIKAQYGSEDLISKDKGQVENGFTVPNRPTKTKSSKKKELYNTMRASINTSRPSSTAATSNFTAVTHQTEPAEHERQFNQLDQTRAAQFEPALFIGNENDLQSNADALGEPSDGYSLRHDEAMQLSKAVIAHDHQANEEHYSDPTHRYDQTPGRTLFDSQPHAQVLQWDSPQNPIQTNKGKKRNYELADEETENQMQDDELSQDTGFQTQHTPARTSNKRRGRPARPVHSFEAGPSHTSFAPSRPEYDHDGLPLESQRHAEAEGDPLGTVDHRQANILAKEVIAKVRAQRPVQKRKPWSKEETDQLLFLIAKYGTSWSAIKTLDQAGADILQLRDQVSLKDKARNIKFDYLKYYHS